MKDKKRGYVYLIGNWTGKVLYIGVTSDLERRMYEHKARLRAGFALKYNLDRLLFYEVFEEMGEAIRRETYLKSIPRRGKEILITRFNPDWRDLSAGWPSSFPTKRRR